MKWRRGLILAGIHLVIAVPLIVFGRMPKYPAQKTHPLYQVPAPEPVASCEVRRSINWQESVLDASELPAAIFSGWTLDCPSDWSTAGMIGIDVRHHTRAQEISSSAIFCLLIAIQWIVVGGLPLAQPRKWWWLEPGACNTASSLISVALCTIAELISAAGHQKLNPNFGILFVIIGFPAFGILYIITFFWIVWLALLLWRFAVSCWKFANQLPDHAAISR